MANTTPQFFFLPLNHRQGNAIAFYSPYREDIRQALIQQCAKGVPDPKTTLVLTGTNERDEHLAAGEWNRIITAQGLKSFPEAVKFIGDAVRTYEAILVVGSVYGLAYLFIALHETIGREPFLPTDAEFQALASVTKSGKLYKLTHRSSEVCFTEAWEVSTGTRVKIPEVPEDQVLPVDKTLNIPPLPLGSVWIDGAMG